MTQNMDIKLTASFEDRGVSTGAKKAAASVREIETAAANTTSKMDTFKSVLAGVGMAAAAMAGAFVAARKVYDFAKEGAAIEFMATKFDRLAQTFGTTGDELSSKLRPALAGLVSDAEAMELATTIMTLGLTQTADQTVRLASVAGQLGMNMNQLVLTLTNRTTMRFDQLGVAVEGFDERVQALIATGMSAEDAFTEAFLQQAEAQIEKVGGIAETSAGQFMQFEAGVKNLGNAIKVWLIDTISSGDGLIGSITEATTAFSMLTANMIQGNITAGQAFALYTKLGSGAMTFEQALEYVNGQIQLQIRYSGDAAMEMDGLKLAFDGTKGTLEAYDIAAMRATDATKEFGDQAQLTKDMVAEANTPLQNMSINFAEMADELTGKLNTGLTSFIDNMIELAKLEAGGWGEIQLIVANILDMYEQGNIDQATYVDLLTDAKLEAEAIRGTFEGMTTDQIAWWINKEMNIPLEEARAYAEGINGEVTTLDSQDLDNFRNALGEARKTATGINFDKAIAGAAHLNSKSFAEFEKHIKDQVRDPIVQAADASRGAKSALEHLGNQKFNALPGAVKRGVEDPMDGARREVERLIKSLDDIDGRRIKVYVDIIEKKGGGETVAKDGAAREIVSPVGVVGGSSIASAARQSAYEPSGVAPTLDLSGLQSTMNRLPDRIAAAIISRREARVN